MDNLLTLEQAREVLELCRTGKIESWEAWIVDNEIPQIDIKVNEYFTHGLLYREIHVPAGAIITGRAYKFDYFDIMVSGHVIAAYEQGVYELQGYNRMDGKAGRKRAGYAVEDCHFVTVHRIDEPRDDLPINEQLSHFSVEEHQKWADRKDFAHVLLELGVSPREVEIQTLNENDRLDIDIDVLGLELKDSPIDGTGMFTKRAFGQEAHVCIGRLNGMRTQAGRYVNHSAKPNCAMRWVNGGDVGLFAIKELAPGDELTCDYRHPELIVMEVDTA